MNMTHHFSAADVAKFYNSLDGLSELRRDNYINTITGMGLPGPGGKSGATYFTNDRLLRSTELQNLYTANGYAARIVDRMVDDATRCDITLTGTNTRFDWWSVQSQLDDLGALSHIGDAWKWGRLYGGGLVVMLVDDGRPFSAPLDLANVRAFRGLGKLDSTNVMVQGWNAALGSAAWSQPTGYQVIMPTSSETADGAVTIGGVIHPSRCIRFDAMAVPAAVMSMNAGWSPSILQRCKVQLEAYGSALVSAQELLQELSVMVLGIDGLLDMFVGNNTDAQAGVREMLRQLKLGIDNFNLLAIDKTKASYQEVKRSVEGLDKMVDRFERDLVGASGMPRLILVGEQASGLGASSGDEVRSWYASVEKEQKYVVTPALNRILSVLFAARRREGLAVPTEWTIKFAPLQTPEPKASAEIAQVWTGVATDLLAAKIITPEQAQDMLVRNGVLDAAPTDEDGDIIEAPAPEATSATETGEPVAPTEATPEAPPVAEQALNGAQVASLVNVFAAIGEGTLAPEAAEWIIRVAVPTASMADVRAAVTAAASAARAGVPMPAPEAPAAATDEEGEEAPSEPPPSKDPVPADAKTAQEIAAELGVSTHRVTRLVREGRVRQWFKLGKKLISVAEIHAVIEEENRTNNDGLAWTGLGCDVCGYGTVESGGEFDPSEPCPECGTVMVTDAASESAKEERIAEAFKKYHETVNMGAAELRKWADTEWSPKASKSRAPIERNLRLLETPREKWTLAHAASAMRTVAFVSRMKNAEQGEPVKVNGREGPSKRDISLKNWAFDPNK